MNKAKQLLIAAIIATSATSVVSATYGATSDTTATKQPPIAHTAVIEDPPVNEKSLARQDSFLIPSHGANMNGMMYVAAGEGPHRTAILLHGFPGNELNADLAQTLRRAGWNTVIFHYRGSWGSEGDFTFSNTMEDALAAVRFLRSPDVASQHRVDTERIALIGYSMGGFVAAQATALDPAVRAAVLISPWEMGRDGERSGRSPKDRAECMENMSDDLHALHGATAEALCVELEHHASDWRLGKLASGIGKRSVLVTAGQREGNLDRGFYPLIAGMRAQGVSVDTKIFPTDHEYSDQRIALQYAVLQWLEQAMPASAANRESEIK
jgi:uncharacterized protein